MPSLAPFTCLLTDKTAGKKGAEKGELADVSGA